jgi:hypothetical protein
MLEDFKKLRDWLSEKWAKHLAAVEEANREQKEYIIHRITREWTPREIYSYNYELAVDSDFWLGGGLTEQDIKKRILNYNYEYFTEEEYDYYYTQISISNVLKK